MDLKVITIDFWNTLFDSTNGRERNEYRHRQLISEMDKHGVAVDKENLNQATAAGWKNFEKYWTEHQRTPECKETVEFMWEYLQLPEQPNSLDNIVKEFEDSLFAHPPVLIEGVRESLERLSENHHLAIISDTGFSPGTHLKQLMKDNDILKYFSSFSFSNETGVSKPHKKAFAAILDNSDNVGVLPEEALHIGDIERTDIDGAVNMGMKSILFTGAEADYDRGNPKDSKADHQTNQWGEITEIIQS